MRTLALVAALFVVSPLTASASPARAPEGASPLVAVAADNDDDTEDAAAGDEPDGCLFTYLCYAMPSGPAAVPWVKDNGLKYVLLYDVGLVVAGFFLPFPALWLPLVLYFLLVDEDVRPPLSGDLLTGLLIMGAISMATSLVLTFVPFGFIASLAIVYWIVPVTGLHIYNRAIRANGDAADEVEKPRPRKKKARPRRKARARDEDDEDE